MRFRAIVSVALIVLFVAVSTGCETTERRSDGQRQDSHSEHSH